MITLVPDEKAALISYEYIPLSDSDILKIEQALNISCKNIDTFKSLKVTENPLATLLRTFTDFKVVTDIDWHPERLFKLLKSALPNLNILLVSYVVTEDHIHYKINYSIQGIDRKIIIETNDANAILDEVNGELQNDKFIEVGPYQWALLPNDSNIEGLAEAAFCIVKES